ncbi:MAG: type IV pilin protein [Thiobacillaceae bacterium]|nr:type IV pilin protein [Thiobacillaceae bacterium]
MRGFTLLELLVAVAIVAILSTVAIVSYQEHIRRSARAEAKAVLLEAAAFMERFYTANGRYTTDAAGTTAPALTGLTQSPKEGQARYTISFQAIAAQSYVLRAQPTGTHSDPDCGTLTLTHTGVRGATGPKGTTECWQR